MNQSWKVFLIPNIIVSGSLFIIFIIIDFSTMPSNKEYHISKSSIDKNPSFVLEWTEKNRNDGGEQKQQDFDGKCLEYIDLTTVLLYSPEKDWAPSRFF